MLREEIHTDNPARHIYVEREAGLTIVTEARLGTPQPWQRIVLEDAEARAVAAIIRQHFPSPSDDSKWVPMLWASVVINIVLLLWLLLLMT